MPVILIGLLVYGIVRPFRGPDERPDPPPESVIFGRRHDCMAVFREWSLLAKPETGLWVLTEQRFLRLTTAPALLDQDRADEVDGESPSLPLEPVDCKVDFEAESARIRYTHEHEVEVKGVVRGTRQRVCYRRIALEDGSGFDIHPDTITELEPYGGPSGQRKLTM